MLLWNSLAPLESPGTDLVMAGRPEVSIGRGKVMSTERAWTVFGQVCSQYDNRGKKAYKPRSSLIQNTVASFFILYKYIYIYIYMYIYGALTIRPPMNLPRDISTHTIHPPNEPPAVTIRRCDILTPVRSVQVFFVHPPFEVDSLSLVT
jgi:hypothetical protein